MKSKHLLFLYFFITLLEMFGAQIFISQGLPYGIWTFKPLLMPILMFWYYKETKAQTSFDKIILTSLFFSWWGDNFLMPKIFDTDINFLLGLGSFLIAHILYIRAFFQTKINASSILKQKPYLALPFLLLGAGLILFLFKQNVPGFTEMSIPVIVYASIIMLMVLSALNRHNKVLPRSFKFVFIGAILFMFSDSFIALNRFTTLFNDKQSIGAFLIMILYVSGQYLIVKGCTLQHGNSN